ncbi:MAG: hypothetical protein WC480_02155 [Patescibacteria group bacterium]
MINSIKKIFDRFTQKLLVLGSRYRLAGIVLAVVLSAVLLNMSSAGAQSSGVPGLVVALVVAMILMIFVALIGGLIMVVFWVLLWIAQYNTFISSGAVVIGWVVVRDVVNMFFVLIFLIIAFATILKIESYNYKRLLPKMIILAILVNFSKTICGLAIDASQVVMLTFVNAFKDVGPGNFINATGITKLLSMSGASAALTQSVSGNVTDAQLTPSGIAGSMFLALIYSVFLLAILVIMVIILAFRVIMLWFLIILSPVFFLLMSFPSGQSYARQWSQQFTKYVITGPILAFFIWLSLAVFGSIDADLKSPGGDASTPITGGDQVPQAGSTDAGSWGFMGKFIISIGMLVAGMSMTGQLGVAGGKLGSAFVAKAQGLGTKVAGAPLAGLVLGSKRIGQRIASSVGESRLAFLTPSFWKGVGKRGDEMYEKSKQRAEGRGNKWWQKAMVGEKAMPPIEQMTELKIQAAAEKKAEEELGGDLNLENMVEGVLRAMQDKTREGYDRTSGHLGLATREGNKDDVYDAVIKKWAKLNPEEREATAKSWGFDDYNHALKGTDETYKIMDMKLLDLGREKFDPEKIFEDMLSENKVDLQALIENKFKSGEYDTRVDAEDAAREELWGQYGAKVKQKQIDNTQNASEDEKRGLWRMQTMTQTARKIGHWEQSTVLKDSQSGLPLLLNNIAKIKDVQGNAAKMDTATFRKSFASHNVVNRAYNKETGDSSIDTRGYEGGSMYNRAMYKYLGPEFSAELHRGQTRFGRHVLRQGSIAENESGWIDRKTGEIMDGTDPDGNYRSKGETLRRLQLEHKKNPKLLMDVLNYQYFGRTGSKDIQAKLEPILKGGKFSDGDAERFSKVLGGLLSSNKTPEGGKPEPAGSRIINPATNRPFTEDEEETAGGTKSEAREPRSRETYPEGSRELLTKMEENVGKLTDAIKDLKGGDSNAQTSRLAQELAKNMENMAKKMGSAEGERLAQEIASLKNKQGTDLYGSLSSLFRKYFGKGK